MKNVLTGLTGFLLFFTASAQFNSPSPTTNPIVFSLFTLPNNHSLLERNALADSANPRAAFVFEYGNGYFTTDVQSAYYYKWAGNYKTVLTLSGRYDTVKPPKTATKEIIMPAGKGDLQEQDILSDSEYIRITPIATDLNVRDEMHFIITYRLMTGTPAAKLYFFYNQPNFDVLQPAIDTSTVWTRFAFPYDIPRLRTHFGEQWDGSATIANVTFPGVQHNFINLLAWNVDEDSGYQERNIFMTLRTNDNLPHGTDGLFIAALGNSGSFLSDTLRMMASANPHDPNYLVAVPKCIPKAPGTRAVKYKLHFQNEGRGPAHRLRIKLFMDAVLTEAISALHKTDFSIKIGGRAIHDTMYTYSADNSTISLNIELKMSLAQENAARAAAGLPPLPPAIDSSLSSNMVSNWFTNPLTMGDIDFTLNVPIDKEADIVSYASIYFYNSAGGSMPAVNTQLDTLFIRDQCSEYLFPRPKPLTKKTDPVCKDCCIRLLFICWWWWIIIAVIAPFIIWWLFSSKRRKNDQE